MEKRHKHKMGSENNSVVCDEVFEEGCQPSNEGKNLLFNISILWLLIKKKKQTMTTNFVYTRSNMMSTLFVVTTIVFVLAKIHIL